MSHSWKLNTFGAGIRCRLRKPDAAQRFIRRGTDRFFTQVIELYPAELYAFALAEVPSTAEAVFFGGNDFRATGMIAALEEDLGRPVITGNQVAFWYALRQAGIRPSVSAH